MKIVVASRDNIMPITKKILSGIVYNNNDIISECVYNHKDFFETFVSTYIKDRYHNSIITQSIVSDIMSIVATLAITLITHE